MAKVKSEVRQNHHGGNNKRLFSAPCTRYTFASRLHPAKNASGIACSRVLAELFLVLFCFVAPVLIGVMTETHVSGVHNINLTSGPTPPPIAYIHLWKRPGRHGAPDATVSFEARHMARVQVLSFEDINYCRPTFSYQTSLAFLQTSCMAFTYLGLSL